MLGRVGRGEPLISKFNISLIHSSKSRSRGREGSNDDWGQPIGQLRGKVAIGWNTYLEGRDINCIGILMVNHQGVLPLKSAPNIEWCGNN